METKEIVTVDPKEFGVDKSKATELMGNLPEIINERKEMEKQYSKIVKMDIEETETAKQASELRRIIKKNRTQGILVWHKTTKDFFLKGGQFVDAIKRKEIAVNERMEAQLEEIEKHAEIQEQRRIEALRRSRIQDLELYAEFVPFGIELGTLSDEEYQKVYNGAKLQHEAKIEAEKKVEEQRLENERIVKQREERNDILLNIQGVKRNPNMTYTLENLNFPDASHLIDVKDILDCEEKQFKAYLDKFLSTEKSNAEFVEKQRKENERLKKEAEAKEKKLKERNEALRPYIIFIRDYDKVLALSDADFKKELDSLNKQATEQAKFEAEQKERQRKEAEKQAKLEEERLAQIKAEREKQAKLEAELQAKKDAEEKAEKERLAAEEKAKKEAERLAKAPIKEKLSVWANSFEIAETDVDNEVSKEIKAKFNAFKNWSLKQIEGL